MENGIIIMLVKFVLRSKYGRLDVCKLQKMSKVRF